MNKSFFPARLSVALHERPRPRLPRSRGVDHGDRRRVRLRDSGRNGGEALHAREDDSVARRTRRGRGITGRPRFLCSRDIHPFVQGKSLAMSTARYVQSTIKFV